MKIGRNKRCPCGSGKKYKYCCLRNKSLIAYELKNKGKQVGLSYAHSSYIPDPDVEDETFKQIFLGEGEEDLTDEVIAELVAQGWPEDDLRRMQYEGGKYNRIRNSIVEPWQSIDEL